MWQNFTTTPIYNACAIRFPQSGSIGEIEIPLHLTKLGTFSAAGHITEGTNGSVIDTTSNMSAGGTALYLAGTELFKLRIEGFVDTPYTILGGSTGTTVLYPNTTLYLGSSLFPGTSSGQSAPSTLLPNVFVDGFRVTYGEIIAAYFEGRTAITTDNPWKLVLPKWFRDPYGRVYTNPRIIDLTIQRVEAVPYRNTFTMTLQV